MRSLAEQRDARVLSRLGDVRMDAKELSGLTGLTVGQLRTVLERLERSGKVRREGGMWETA